MAPVTHSRDHVSKAFTLIELMTVMGIMAFLLAVALGASLGWGRVAGKRASVLQLRTSLDLARQLAASHGERMQVQLCNTNGPSDRGYYVTIKQQGGTLVGNTNYLARNYLFGSNGVTQVVFAADGSCSSNDTPSDGNLRIVLQENRPSGLASTLTVFVATGYVKEEE